MCVCIHTQVTAAALCCKIKNTNKNVKEFPWLLSIKTKLSSFPPHVYVWEPYPPFVILLNFKD